MSGSIANVTDATFDTEVLQSATPVLVDYWAEWCAPCKRMLPTLEEAATEYAGRVKFAKLDIQENAETPAKFAIRNIPTLMLFKNGAVEAVMFGAKTKAELNAFLDANLK